MLNLILGQSGSGKTHEMIKRIKQVSKENKRILVIVPEQYSFATERKLTALLEGEEIINVEVLSFTRLCEDIFSHCNADSGEYINDSGRHILMSVALNQLRNQLKLYRKYCDRIEFISSMVITMTELKYAGIGCGDFFAAAQTCNDSFGDKLRELALIYTTYQSLLDNGFCENDDFKKAVKLAMESAYFSNTHVFIDSFTAFMAGERELISCMLEDSESTTVCVCTDNAIPVSDPSDVFYSPKKTISKLIKIAQKLNQNVEIKTLSANKRQTKSDLLFLSENFLKNKNESFNEDTENVEIYKATDEIGEIEYIAAKIGDLVRNHGYRYRDIVMVTRTSEKYLETIGSIFSRYNIPVFYDKRNEILKTPLIKTVLAFLSMACARNQTDAAFSFLKSTFSPFDFSDVCELENYAFVWNLEFKDFFEPFKKDIGGLSKTGEKEKLDSINFVRSNLCDLYTDFVKDTKHCNGKTFAMAVYNFLKQSKIQSVYSNKILSLKNNGDISAANELVAIWNALVNCLEQMAISLKDTALEMQEMTDLLTVAISGSDYANIPHHIDEVSVGDANRIRYNEPKIVFLFGANDGEFPQIVTENSIIDKRERVFLKENDLQLDTDTAEAFSNERMYAYHAVSACVDKLFVSYCECDIKGNTHTPSLIVSEIKNILPKVQQKTFFDIDKRIFLHTLECVRHRYAKEFLYGGKVKNAFEKLNLDKTYTQRLEKAVSSGKDFTVRDKKLTEKLFGKKIKLSASQIEDFYKCRFSYFCKKALRARPLEKADMSPLQSGNFIHYCLYRLVMDNGKDGLVLLTDQEIFLQIENVTNDYLKDLIDVESALDSRFEVLLLRLRGSVMRLVKRIQSEFQNTDFIPVKFEAKIGEKDAITPIEISLSNDGKVIVEGAIDRVDEYELDGVKYVRVVDYKSGTKEFKLSDISFGLNMQMLLYLFTLCECENKQPAAVLYMPSGDKYVTANSNDDEIDICAQRLKEQKMSGVVLNNVDVISAMEHNIKGVYLPVDTIKDGSISKKSSVISGEEFVNLRNLIGENLRQMGEALNNGDFYAKPTEAKEYNVCNYCPYINICGIDQNSQNSDTNE